MKLSERLADKPLVDGNEIETGLYGATEEDIEELAQLESSLADKDKEIERYRELRNELASLYDENEPHDMGGPHISLMYIVDRMDEVELWPTKPT